MAYRVHSRLCGSELAAVDRGTATLDGSSAVVRGRFGEIWRRHCKGNSTDRVDVASRTNHVITGTSLVAGEGAPRDGQDVRAVSTDGTASRGHHVRGEGGARHVDLISVRTGVNLERKHTYRQRRAREID